MTPSAWARALRQESAEVRATFLRALTAAEVETDDAALIAVLLCDTSLQGREVAEARLSERSAARRALRPPPPTGLDESTRRGLAQGLADDPRFAAALLPYPRGRELLLSVPLAEHPLDELLMELALEADEPAVIREVLALPVDLSGRGVSLIDALRGRPPSVREEVLAALVWAALQEAGETADEERRRARVALVRWAGALLDAPAGASDAHLRCDAPAWEEFLGAGGTIARGPVTEAVPLPGERARTALGPLARCLRLLLAPPEGLLERAALEADLASGLAELRVAAWRRLLQEGLAAPEEVAGVAARESPGAAIELLRALPADLPPAARPALTTLLHHSRAAVRAAAARTLERSPLLAAMCVAGLDPRAPGTPLPLLRALPPALRDPLLSAWLEGLRPPGGVIEALGLFERPPGASWSGWSLLLGHADLRVRAAAASTLGRLPAEEGPALHPLLRELLAKDAGLGLPLAARFGLGEARLEASRRLLAPTDPRGAEAAAEALALLLARPLGAEEDGAAWATLWTALLRRGVPRAARQRALAALLEHPGPRGEAPPKLPDGSTPDWLAQAGRPSPDGALLALLRGRDPEGVRLATRWMLRRGVPAGLWGQLDGLTRDLLARVHGGGLFRGWSALGRRFLRRLFGRRRVAPPGAVRGRGGAARALAGLLELFLRCGVSTLRPEELEPLARHRDAELAGAARRLQVALLGPFGLGRLLADPLLAEEAVRVAHPDLIEARLLLDLRAGGAETDRALARAALRPSPGLGPALAPLLAERPIRTGVVAVLRALGSVPGGREVERGLLRDELRRAAAASQGREADPRELAGAAELLQAAEAWELASELIPALHRAREAARDRLAALLRAAGEAGASLDRAALAGLLSHPVESVRELAISLLRRTGTDGLWALVRPLGPGPTPRGAELTGRFLGACEDAWEESMGLAAEGLLRHADPVVARRALKLLVQNGREVAALALLQRLDDDELRQPALTAISTWSARFIDPSRALAAELLEEKRRELRALIDRLANGPRGQAQAALAEAWAHPVPFARVAACLAVARHGLEGERAQVAAGLLLEDPPLLRAAALAAGALAAGPDLDGPLERLAGHRDAEVRLEARSALLRHLPADHAGLEALLLDAAPEVRLGALRAAGERPEPGAGLEARLADPDPRVREEALRQLERRSPGDVSRLAGVLRDPWPEVRRAAIGVVRAWGGAEQVRAEIGELLADPAPAVAQTALALVESGAKPA